MKKNWNCYILKIDLLMKSAIICCVKRTFKILLQHISPNSSFEDTKIKIRISAEIKNEQVYLFIKLFVLTLIFFIIFKKCFSDCF